MADYKHDYAGIFKKIRIKLYLLFLKIIPQKEIQRLFYRSYRHINHRSRRSAESCPELYMTQEPNPVAGFGHGIDIWRNGVVNARTFELKYAYYPMVTEEWDKRLGFGEGIPDIKDLKKKGYKVVKLPYYDPKDSNDVDLIKRIIDSYSGERIVFLNEFEQPGMRNYGSYAREFMRGQFWRASARQKDRLIFDEKKINVAVHIRRGDVTKDSKDQNISMRWLDNSYYMSVLEQILSVIDEKEKLKIYIFSEGDNKDFAEFEQLPCPIEFCLNMNVIDSFIHMCWADLLVVGLSSFSADPGHINPALKIVPSRFWGKHPDNGEWIVADEQGIMTAEDVALLKERIIQDYKLK